MKEWPVIVLVFLLFSVAVGLTLLRRYIRTMERTQKKQDKLLWSIFRYFRK